MNRFTILLIFVLTIINGSYIGFKIYKNSHESQKLEHKDVEINNFNNEPLFKVYTTSDHFLFDTQDVKYDIQTNMWTFLRKFEDGTKSTVSIHASEVHIGIHGGMLIINKVGSSKEDLIQGLEEHIQKNINNTSFDYIYCGINNFGYICSKNPKIFE